MAKAAPIDKKIFHNMSNKSILKIDPFTTDHPLLFLFPEKELFNWKSQNKTYIINR